MSETPPSPPVSAAERAAMLRVDQAGEYGATRIYAGQLAVMGDRGPVARSIARMAAQEERHRLHFDGMIAERGVRPTLLAPLWDVAGFALGAATALIGPKAAMACTAAIETEIDLHYEEQRQRLGESDPPLGETIAEFQAEEVEHREEAIAQGAEQAPAYPFLSAAIRAGCRFAIRVSTRI
ncbi:demethoxyubiquinone hydroxylase family protein [Sphingomonas naphthae]|uniref:3-demethoxyubiquinol 3-hydroxylase n=1 Tax=Sphingomonas naphthae TaxID=1813468 RepID=A0ABY7TFJ7_9SPHN|nr:demethoxyubiquinone hydroxylase family protein [Sphingomonas naphthae]WCT71915.1 demethoxyubiquinone hydroxylase family protein [Sphingomonas naphthae]